MRRKRIEKVSELDEILAEQGRHRYLSLSRRALLLSAAAAGVASVAAIYEGVHRAGSDDASDGDDGPVSAGPATSRVSGTLAGPAAKPVWSASLAADTNTQAVAVAGGTVIVVGGDGSLHGRDAATGAARWTSPVEVAPAWNSPIVVVGDIVHLADPNGDVLAVDSSNGSVRWQVQLPQSEAEVSSVRGVAGPLVFCSGDAHTVNAAENSPMLWAIDTVGRRMAWTLESVASNLAISASESAGVVVVCDEIAQLATCYAVKDGSPLWRKAAAQRRFDRHPDLTRHLRYHSRKHRVLGRGSALRHGRRQRERAVDRARFRRCRAVQSVVVLPGLGTAGANLVVATTTSPTGGALYAFAEGRR